MSTAHQLQFHKTAKELTKFLLLSNCDEDTQFAVVQPAVLVEKVKLLLLVLIVELVAANALIVLDPTANYFLQEPWVLEGKAGRKELAIPCCITLCHYVSI